jgi:hypothetical protein
MVSRRTISQLSALIQRGGVGSQLVDQIAPSNIEQESFSNWGNNMLGDIQQYQQGSFMPQQQPHEQTMNIQGSTTSRRSGGGPSLISGTPNPFSTTMPQMENPVRFNTYEQQPFSQSIQGSNLGTMTMNSRSDHFSQVPPFLGLGFGQSGPAQNTVRIDSAWFLFKKFTNLSHISPCHSLYSRLPLQRMNFHWKILD